MGCLLSFRSGLVLVSAFYCVNQNWNDTCPLTKPGLGTRSTSTRPGCKAWVRGQEHISCCTWRINELNCKTMDRQERLKRRREYERARHSAETAEQKELRLSRRREADRARRAAT